MAGEPHRRRVEARTGTALVLERGQRLTVVDLEGEQVADLVAYAREDPDEHLSNGRTFDHGGSLHMTTGSVLYSSRSRPMLTIVADTVGRHDFLFAPCSVDMFRAQYGVEGEQPNCLDNLRDALRRQGIEAPIPTPLNVFMNAPVQPDGRVDVLPPLSRAGDHVTLRAEADLVVAVSACSAPTCNNGVFGPIELVVEPS
jgi:hypothetical protein